MKQNNLFKTAALLLMMALPMLAATNVNAQGGTTCETSIVLTDTSRNILADHSNTNDLWYKFTPTKTAAYTVSNCGNNYASLSMYEGASCDAKKNIEYADYIDYGYCGQEGERRTFLGEAGKTYYINWGNSSGKNYNWSLISISPEGLKCETPIVLTGTSNNISAPFTDKQCDELYYSFTPTTSGYYTANVLGASPLIYIEAFITTCKNYNSNIFKGFGYNNVTFYAEVGTTYHISMRIGESEELQNITWEFKNETNPAMLTCQTAQVVNIGNNISAPCADRNSQSFWYSFTPTQTTAYKITSDVSKDSNEFVLFDNCEDLEYVADGWNFYAEQGKTYHILAVFLNKNTNYTWNLQIDANPEGVLCQTPIALTDTSSNILAPHGDKDVRELWYAFTPKKSGAYTASNCGMTTAEDYISLYVYRGSCENLNFFTSGGGCGSGSGYEEKEATFWAEAGSTYYINWTNDERKNYNWKLTEESKVEFVTSIHLQDDSVKVEVGDSKGLYSYTYPSDGLFTNISWEIRNPSIAKLDTRNGTDVIGLAPGTTYVVVTVTTPTATLKDSCMVIVTGNVVLKGISVTPKTHTLQVGTSVNLSVAAMPSNAVLPTIQWSSRNTAVATIDNNMGRVVAVAEGSTYIVATSTTGGFKDSCLVTVTATTGINDVETETASFKVYPNPVTNEKLVIKNEEWGASLRALAKQSQNIELFDLTGKLVGTYAITGSTTEINISHLPSGTYLVKVGNETVKIIKR